MRSPREARLWEGAEEDVSLGVEGEDREREAAAEEVLGSKGREDLPLSEPLDEDLSAEGWLCGDREWGVVLLGLMRSSSSSLFFS